MAEYETPAFLQNTSTDDFFEKIKAILPSDIDLSEGGDAWNFTRPAAMVAAFICEFVAPELINLINPETSYGEYLDGHARSKAITRRGATAASGYVTIVGDANTVIPAGSVFSTAAVNETPSVDYATTEEATIPEGGSVTIHVECTQTGTIGNTPAGTVVMVSGRMSGVTSVTNEQPITGGTEEESDESLIERIVEYNKSQDGSYTGNPADYKRWAKSVAGVGEATVISAQDDSGLVTIILTDANGSPANTDLCNSVYNYIMRPDSEYERLAPVNAYLQVIPPTTTAIVVQATIELVEGYSIEAVQADFARLLALYLQEAMDEGEVKYSRIWSVLSECEGVNDHTGLLVGLKDGEAVELSTANIPITSSQLPDINEEDLLLTTGAVE